jgi:endonuclease/exonuclease/phosphatase family metal-dependent hydrolase
MRYAFAPQIGDLYGHAVLSRLPLADVRRLSFPKEPGLRYQPRGAMLVRAGGLWLVGTHLDHNTDASRVREDQVRAILDLVGDRRPALVVGDLNALAGSSELALLERAGFTDLAVQAGAVQATFPAREPVRRIDYAFGRGVTASQVHVVATRAADHRPLVMNIARSAE